MQQTESYEYEKVFSESLNNSLAKYKENASGADRDMAICRCVASALVKCICKIPPRKAAERRAAYFSAEFLPGNILTQTLAGLNLQNICKKILNDNKINFDSLSSIPDPALGNGGLGRLAACLLDSAAACRINLDGYGIRYRYGLFKQKIEGDEQREIPDAWQHYSFLEKENRKDIQSVVFGDMTVNAVPFDIPIVGKNTVNRLRLWQCEAPCEVDFEKFSKSDFSGAFEPTDKAASVSAFLYPADDTDSGKELRLKQQYFFCSASIGSILKDFSKTGKDIFELSEYIKIQLNDTHPTVAIPEMIRRLCEDFSLSFDDAFDMAGQIFSYTNHTVMAEALERWSVSLFSRVLPAVYPYIVMIDNKLTSVFKNGKQTPAFIIENGFISMADMAVFVCRKVNGVAKIHTEIIKSDVFNSWYKVFPNKFINITNGISHRRFLCLANPELSAFADERIGTEWRSDLKRLEKIADFNSNADIAELCKIKHLKKKQLCDYLKQTMQLDLDPDFMFSVQIKRIHEYKRQLLNVLAILGLYIDIKNLEIKDMYPTAFIFSGKAAPGYYNAKQVIKLINATSKLIESDETARRFIKIVFIPDYNVKNAMKIIPAADLSEQLSMAGTEASGTGNMKLSLNGAPTIGTMDGANIEIVGYAGEENNYIFGATNDEIKASNRYDPMDIYYTNDRISRVLDLIKEGPAGDFESLFKSLLFKNDFNEADKYRVLMDYPSYYKSRLTANEDFKNADFFGRKCLKNIAAASHFSSDDTVLKYNSKIWGL